MNIILHTLAQVWHDYMQLQIQIKIQNRFDSSTQVILFSADQLLSCVQIGAMLHAKRGLVLLSLSGVLVCC